MAQQLFGEPVLPRLPVLLQQVREGQIQIPDFQRQFIWSDKQRVELLDSIYRQLPIGSLLIWRTSAHPDMARRAKLGIFSLPPPGDPHNRNYVLDGLHRLATLYCAFSRPPEVFEGDEAEAVWPIYCDVENPDEVRFLILPSRRQPTPSQAPVWIFFDDDAFDAFREQLPAGGHHRRALRAVETRFRDYVIPVVPLLTDDLDSVKEAFVRVNSSGTRMSEAAMVRAFSLDGNFDLEERFDDIREQISSSSWRTLEDEDILAIIKVLFGANLYQGDPRKLAQSVKRNGPFLAAMPRILETSFSLLESWGIGGPKSLPYIYLLAGICDNVNQYILKNNTNTPPREEVERDLVRLFFSVSYGEVLSGASSAKIYEAIHLMIPPSIPSVSPISKLNTSSVRGKLALCSMARTGQEFGDNHLPLTKRYGEGGSDVVLSIGRSPSRLEERIISTPEERERLKALLKQRGAPLNEGSISLLRSHLFLDPDETVLPKLTNDELLDLRRKRLEEAEKQFVQGLGFTWEDSVEPGGEKAG